jgi:hypothetical protein
MILQLDRISKSYPSGEQHPRVILDELDLDVQPVKALPLSGRQVPEKRPCSI